MELCGVYRVYLREVFRDTFLHAGLTEILERCKTVSHILTRRPRGVYGVR